MNLKGDVEVIPGFDMGHGRRSMSRKGGLISLLVCVGPFCGCGWLWIRVYAMGAIPGRSMLSGNSNER